MAERENQRMKGFFRYNQPRDCGQCFIRIYGPDLEQLTQVVGETTAGWHVAYYDWIAAEINENGQPVGAYTAVLFTLETAEQGAVDRDPTDQKWHKQKGTDDLTAIQVDLDITGVPDANEVTVGAVVVRRADGNEAPRREVVLNSCYPDELFDWAVLERSSAKVKVYDAETGGNEITFNGTDNRFEIGSLPKSLWVQGDIGSGSMRDVDLKLYPEGYGAHFDDVVKFTVLWVIVTTDHADAVNADNPARDWYSFGIVPPPEPPCYALGHHLFTFTGLPALGRGSEFIGNVQPSNFVPQEFAGHMELTRELVSGRSFWGPTGSENPTNEDPGLDPSDPLFRDDDPQSGGSAGKIYDVDAPGRWVEYAPANTILRWRVNFRAWAEYGGVRCSEMKPWYTRQSYKKTGSSDDGTVTGAGPGAIADNTKNWTPGEWVPGLVYIIAGTGAGRSRQVTGNGATTIAVSPDWVIVPDNTSQYEVANSSAWTQINDVPNDNVSADGTTPITWDLQ